MIAGELVGQAHVLLGHVAAEASAAFAARRVVRVGAERGWLGQLSVTTGADAVASDGPELLQVSAPVLAVRVVAGRALELGSAAAEQEVARFSRVGGAAARLMTPLPALPGVPVLREEHGVTLGAGAALFLRGGQRLAIG